MTATQPLFTVVMATWGRGRHILPSITSVLQQDFPGFELIVVGDACTDETEAVVTGLTDPRVRWLNLTSRCRSQSAPNNAGIASARGRYIAYLGHDDIWEPDHLDRLLALYRSAASPDFAVSGAIFHLPNGLAGDQVTGIFPDGADVSPYFFPPSSFSHVKTVIDRIGPWRMPMDLRAPVDEDLLLRAVGAGLQFRSTAVVTVHKFAAGHRYLSYVGQESREQLDMLASMATPNHKARIADLVEAARSGGTFMVGSIRNFDHFEPGAFARKSRQVKGLNASVLMPLGSGVTVQHPEEDSLFDWQEKPDRGYRLTKANPRPRLLLPVTGGRVRLRFLVMHRLTHSFGPLEILCNGERVIAKPGWPRFLRGTWTATYRATIELRETGPSVLEFLLNMDQRPSPSGFGIAVGPLNLAPVRWPFSWF